MTKYDFLGDLNRLLQDLPEDERRQAMQYYEDYFADAGEENEQEVIRELGTPESVAASIKGEADGQAPEKDLPATVSGQGESDGQQSTGGQQFADGQQSTGGQQFTDGQQSTGGQNRRTISQWITDTWNNLQGNPPLLILVCIAAVICIPVIFGALASIFSTVFGLMMGIFGVILALWIGGGITVCVGVLLAINGIIKLVSAPAMGALMLGSGMITFAVGAALFMAATYLATRTLPFLFRKIGGFCQRQFGTAGV